MVKLAEMGINGRMWSWIKSFFSDRQVTHSIRSTQGQTAASETSLPQESVLSPLLFNLFIMCILKDIKGNHCKFADDGTLWHRGKAMNTLAEKVCSDLKVVFLSVYLYWFAHT